MSQAFGKIYSSLKGKKRDKLTYWIPKLWLTADGAEILEEKDGLVRVEPYSYFLAQLGSILEQAEKGVEYSKSLSQARKLKSENGRVSDGELSRLPGDWMATSSFYGFYMRNFTAFDHDQNGELGGAESDITLNSDGMKETGTFLKAMALLPYIKSLGFDVVYTLPVALTGIANRKGELGSPYGLKNPMKIAPIFHDPLLDGFQADEEFQAFIEAAHMLRIRVALDFVPRTASRDSEFIKEHPEWFYWIKRSSDKDYHSPEFTQDELREIHHRVNNWYDDPEHKMIPPHADYIELFTEAPKAEDVKFVSDEVGYVGTVNGEEVVVPGAFADWPPDDVQPPWTDVTYLKLYNDTDYNYVAYNTVRMYDGRITKKNETLWEMLGGIIPFYQKNFGLDGARIDMGHSLPHEVEELIINEARKTDFDFGFLSEDFNVWAQARAKGYNMVLSNSWWSMPRTNRTVDNGDSASKTFIKRLPEYPNPVWLTGETPDTPRAASRPGGIKFSKAVFALACTAPNAVPLCPAGFELGDAAPTNLGLDFTPEQIAEFSKKPLAFFDRAALSWQSDVAGEVSGRIKELLDFRLQELGNILHLDNFSWVESEADGHPSMSPENPFIAYMRIFHEENLKVLTSGIFGQEMIATDSKKTILVIANMDCEHNRSGILKMVGGKKYRDVFTGRSYQPMNDNLVVNMVPGEVVIAVLED